MARDRKRAKQRAQRRGGPRPGRPGDGAGGSSSALTRADLPGPLEHMGDVDEFDAAIVRGAGGEPLSAQEEEALAAVETREEQERLGGRGNGRGNGVAATPVRTGGAEGREARPAVRPAGQSLPARAVAFLRASWAELQRVQWPNRAQVTQATAVVLGFVAVAGIYFGVADYVAKEIVEAIL